METTPKPPQEIAAQMMDVYPQYNASVMPEEHVTKLDEQAKAVNVEVENLQPYTLSDDELAKKLADVCSRAIESGVWEPTKGEGADERLAYAMEKNKSYGFTEQEALDGAMKDLGYNGYLDAIRYERKEKERLFKDPINEYVNGHNIDKATEKHEADNLLERTIDITTLTPAELAKLSQDFPSGNFIYHGASTEQLVKIIDSGTLLNAKALYEREDQDAIAEGREAGIVQRNSGYEGISWSMNGIDALPGDRYHLAGFVAAPEAILLGGTQLAVPKRPSPNEVVLLDGEIDAALYYEVNTQIELYEAHDRNSVLGGILELAMGQTLDGDTPTLKKILSRLENEPELTKLLKDGYTITPDNNVVLNPDLLSSDSPNDELPVAAVWLQALVDSGRLEGTEFKGMGIMDVINAVTDINAQQLYAQLHRDVDAASDKLKSEPNNVEVPVENMYFVAPRKDAEAWLRVFARSNHKPAGMLLYDDKKVRLENFASLHRGDHAELTNELRTAISPANEGYIEYTDVLGSEFSDDMRSGHKHQVIAEKYLANRKTVRYVDGKLVVAR